MQNNWETIINPLMIQGMIPNGVSVNSADGFYPDAYFSSQVEFFLKVKDIAGTGAATGYTDLKLKTVFENNTVFNHVASGWNGSWASWNGASHEQPYTNNMVTVMRMGANIDPSHPTTGLATTKLKFEIWGTSAIGVNTKLDEYVFSFNCYYRNWIEPFILNKNNTFVYYQGSNVQVGHDILMCFEYSYFFLPPQFILSSTNPNIIIGSNPAGAVLSPGSNPAIARVGLNTAVVQALAVGLHTYPIDIAWEYTDANGMRRVGNSVQNFIIDVRAAQTQDIVIYAIKNLSGIINKNIALNHPALVSSNAAINYTNTSVCSNVLLPNGTMNIIFDSNSQPLGTYNGVLSVFDGAVLRYIINIKVVVTDFLSADIDFSKNIFTLDPQFFNFNTARTDTYFQFDATITSTKFETGLPFINETIKQKIVPFKGKAKLNLGLSVHRLMDRFLTINNNTNQYMPATVSIVCEERQLIDNVVVNTTAGGGLPQLKYVAGLSKNIDRYGFLSINHKESRITKKGYALLNTLFYWDDNSSICQTIDIYKNGFFLDSINLITDPNYIRLDKFTFDQYQPGDVIEYGLWDSNNFHRPIKLSSKKYIVFPDNRYSNMIVWEDAFLLQSAMEFTGSHSIKTDIEFVTQKLYANLIEHLQIIDTTKDVKLTINTGWILKTDIDSVESLMRSRRAWLDKGNNETIALRPISKTIINEDSEKELIEYTIEFLINRNYNEETYTL
jgi:hypothetical protein